MKVTKLDGTDFEGDYVLEVLPEDLYEKSELLDENKKLKDELEEEKDRKESIMLSLSMEAMAQEESRKTTAFTILERERKLQEDREKEWEKEKRDKRIKRGLRTAFWVIICVILLFAWLSGYRIPIPYTWVETAEEIWSSAVTEMTKYFVVSQ